MRTEILDPSSTEALIEGGPLAGLVNHADARLVVEHEPLPFPNFPYEWSPEMLHAAGRLTLDLAESLLDEGLGLKDATPYNIIFRGADPVFVDLLSFELRDPGDPIWLPQAQFERTFLLPLLVNKYFGIPLDQLLGVRRDGLEPEEVYRLCSPLRRLAPRFLSLVSIPVWLGAGQNEDDQSIYQKKTTQNAEKARFILRSGLKRMRRNLDKLEPDSGRKSAWSDYLSTNNNYSDAQFAAKCGFVEDAMSEFKPRRVLDVGCNTGHFSAIAAKSGASVVAIDGDPIVLGETWRRSRAENLDILPLAVNLARPTPAIGWRNGECPAFLDRGRGAFDAVMMLAVVHHMLVSERIPLEEIIDLAGDLTTDIAIIEFVGPDDSMFRRLTRGRDHLFADLSAAVFEVVCRRQFEVVRSRHLNESSRWIYLLRKK